MSDTVSILQAACKKLASKVERLRTQLEAAETELAENQTAIRVLTRIGGAASSEGGADEAKASSQEQVLKILPVREAEAKTPREVHQALTDAGVTNISADNVRTILSRLKKDELLPVRVTLGRYWRAGNGSEPMSAIYDAEDDFEDLTAYDAEPAPSFDEDLDSEVPF
jgi:hypothetical protein